MEEDTKEIKDLKDIETLTEDNVYEDNTIEELEPEILEEEKEVKEETLNNNIEEKKDNKKTYIIIGSVIIVLLLLIILLVVLINKNKKVEPIKDNNDSSFVTTVKKALGDGSLTLEIYKGLEELEINTDSVQLLYMDIDSDNKNEIVAYAIKDNKNGIIQLEVNDDISYEDSYPMDSNDSLGYVYSSENNYNYWYVLKEKNYTLISSAKKIIKEEDFLNNYYIITKTYHKKNIIENSIIYRLDNNLDAEELEKLSFTNEELLIDNDIDSSLIKDSYNKYIKEKKEEEEKKKREEEEKAKLEKEKQKLEGKLQLGNIAYKYGTYNIYLEDGSLDGTLIIYSDSTCIFKGINCTYSIETITPNDDEMIPVITLSTGHIYRPGEVEGELTDEDGKIVIRYAG